MTVKPSETREIPVDWMIPGSAFRDRSRSIVSVTRTIPVTAQDAALASSPTFGSNVIRPQPGDRQRGHERGARAVFTEDPLAAAEAIGAARMT